MYNISLAFGYYFFASFVLGRYSGISIDSVFKILVNQIVEIFEQTWEVRDVTVVIKLRLPRIWLLFLWGYFSHIRCNISSTVFKPYGFP